MRGEARGGGSGGPGGGDAAARARRTVDAIWRIESPRLIAALTRMVRDVGVAEDLAQDALVAALETWPRSGVPDNPGAWLMATAKHRAIDLMRRARTYEDKREQVEREVGLQFALGASAFDAAHEEVGDDLLALMFICCHPLLGRDAQAALTLRLLGGLTTKEIARAFLAPEATIGQRISRAKRTLAQARAAFEVPAGDELGERLAAVMRVVYLIFNEGYAATAGDDWIRRDLCEEALRLGRMLAELAPREGEVHGLVALMEIQASRLHARTGPDGAPILLLDQDRSRWDLLLIGRGLKALDRAEALGDARGPYALQAAIAACHARARTPQETDWPRIAALYAALAQVQPSPVVELNRAVALAMAFGPEVGLRLADEIAASGALDGYHLLPAVRADLLARLGRAEEARDELARAAELTGNEQERGLLLARMATLGGEAARARRA
ncbi:RNA polymerase sigma factor (sigma-70 family) [Conexibacter arvalis]|uniref:RNA polymerase sigma factor (Sigma-70 family) n=1 Tax=Conexibacter arvalis TaxID=912552 RepID=A0A840I744_9ACTN|nr:RNA polymerase sigma factor (sigma-70 family) [Conexibacter arvalis]